jgi:hypothetical protein
MPAQSSGASYLPGGLGYFVRGAACLEEGTMVPYLLTRRIQITPMSVIARGASIHPQSEKPCKASAVMAMARRTNPVMNVALATTIGDRVMGKSIPV